MNHFYWYKLDIMQKEISLHNIQNPIIYKDIIFILFFTPFAVKTSLF